MKVFRNDMNIQKIVTDYIVQNFLNGESRGFNTSTSLFDLGILDSRGILKMMRFLEQTFSITITDEEYIPDYYLNVQRIEMFINEKLAKKM